MLDQETLEKGTFFVIASIVIGAGVLLALPAMEIEEPKAPPIVKTKAYCQEHSKLETIWYIEKDKYMVEHSPKGYPEIIGLYSRFHSE